MSLFNNLVFFFKRVSIQVLAMIGTAQADVIEVFEEEAEEDFLDFMEEEEEEALDEEEEEERAREFDERRRMRQEDDQLREFWISWWQMWRWDLMHFVFGQWRA